jgi:uncharacterized membrane protein YukC
MSTSTQVMELFNIFSKTYSKEEAQVIVKDIEEIIDSRKQDLAAKDILELRKAIQEVEFKIKKNEVKIEQAKTDVIKWVATGWIILLFFIQFAIIFTVLKLMK